jgi:pimeloyl-ACP methyl ester carboxylesterase
MRRLLKRAAQLALGLVALVALVLAGFLVRSLLVESESRTDPKRSGAFIRTPSGETRYQERGGAKGRPLVFIGGTMAPSDTFLPLMDELCDARLRCVAIDLPPSGYSERPSDGNYSRERQAARIADFVRGRGLRNVVLVGHSFGAGPTVEAAMRNPDDIRTFVLLAGALALGSGPPSIAVRSALAVGPLRTSLAAATLVNPWAIRLSLRSFIENDEPVIDEVVYRLVPQTRVEGTAAAAGRWAQTALFGDARESLSADPQSYRQYSRPVLLIWGDKDTATPLAQAEELAGLLPAATLRVIPGVGHFPHIEAQSQVVVALRSFLLAN